MTLLLWAAYGIIAIALVLYGWREPRRAILFALVFTTFCMEALPVRLVPISGFAPAMALGSVVLVVMWRLARHDPPAGNPAPGFEPYTLLMITFWVFLIAMVLGVAWPENGTSKVTWFSFKVMMPLIALRMMAPFDARDLRVMFASLLTGAVLVAANLAVFGIPIALGRSYDDAINPISLGRVVCTGGAIALVVTAFDLFRHPLRALALAPVGLGLAYTVALNGERGPLLAIGLAVIGAFFFAAPDLRGRASALFVGTLAACAVMAVLSLPAAGSETAGVQRIVNNLQSVGENTSDAGRVDRFAVAWQGFVDTQGVGVGTGGFAALNGAVRNDYPHNLIMEVAVEQGLGGLCFLGTLLALGLWRLTQVAASLGDDTIAKAVLCVWFSALLNAMVSSDLVGNGSVFLIGAIAWMTGLPEPAGNESEEALYETRVCQPG